MILNDVRDSRPSSPALVSVLWASLVRVPLRFAKGTGPFPLWIPEYTLRHSREGGNPQGRVEP